MNLMIKFKICEIIISILVCYTFENNSPSYIWDIHSKKHFVYMLETIHLSLY